MSQKTLHTKIFPEHAYRPKMSMKFAHLVIISLVLISGLFLSFDIGFASQESGILHPDGVQNNATYDSTAPTQIQFQIVDDLENGDVIEITFPTEFGTVDDTNLVVRQDSDDTPCDGAVVSQSSSVASTRIVEIVLQNAINGGVSICVEGLQMATPNPSQTLTISIQTKSGVNNQTLDFGAAIHDGDPTGSATAVSATVGVFIDLLIEGLNIEFPEVDLGDDYETGAGVGFGGSTLTVSTNT